MKPEDLIDAMDMISQDYITEAKPAAKRHNGSRSVKRSAAGISGTVTVSRSSAATGKDYTVKKQTTIQRIMTGIAATAACAVFACGGWFIVRQTKQQRIEASNVSAPDSLASDSDSSMENVQPSFTNFLGGQGEVHVLPDSIFYTTLEDGYIMYDDTRWYFRSGACYAERNADTVTAYRSLPGGRSELMPKILYDGSSFYYLDASDGVKLYILHQDGSHPQDPFFVPTAEMLPPGSDAGQCALKYWFRMTDDAYLAELATGSGTAALVYHTDGSVNLLPADTSYSRLTRCEDGSVLAVFSGDSKQDGVVRIGTDGTVEEITRFSGETNLVEYMSVHGDQLYILLYSVDPDSAIIRTDYAALDLNTHDIRILDSFSYDQDPYVKQAFTNGQQDFVVKEFREDNRNVLFRTDSEWKNQEEMFTMSASADLPEEIRKRCSFPESASNIIRSIYADERYVMLGISGAQYVLCDLETGGIQYFHPYDEPEGDMTESDMLQLDESMYTALDPDFTGTNFLGGTGSLYIPKNPESFFLYDNDRYYVGDAAVSKDETALKHFVPDADYPFRTAKAEGRILCDGKRLYVAENGTVSLIDSSGSCTPFLRLTDAGVPAGARVEKIRCVGDACFICGSNLSDITVRDTDQRAFYIWADKDGRILESRNDLFRYAQFDFASSDPSDGSLRYAYYWNGMAEYDGVHRLAAPGSGEQEKIIALPDDPEGEERYSRSVHTVLDDRLFYYDKDGNCCCYDPDANEKRILLDASVIPSANFAFAGGKIYYTLPGARTEAFSTEPVYTNLMQYDPETNEEKILFSLDSSALDISPWVEAWDGRHIMIYQSERQIIYGYDTETNELIQLHYT